MRAIKSKPGALRPAAARRRPTARDSRLEALLGAGGAGRSVSYFKAKQAVFRQGDPGDAVFYILAGQIRLIVRSDQGKKGVVGLLSAGEFFGEGCLVDRTVRIAAAVAVTASKIVRIERETMIGLLHEQPAVADAFMAFLLSRNIEIESDLVDQLFNSSERRLARALLLLADFGKDGHLSAVITKISQDVLASQVGTSRSRINFFMNKFRKLGLIEYGPAGSGTLKVHPSLLDIIVPD